MNALHYGQVKHLETKMEAWSDDSYEQVPFTCSKSLSDEKVRERIWKAITKRFPPRHYAGCGYSCSINKFVRETPTSGHVVLCHYQGIGD